jgi:hypothetical protein
MAEKTEFLPFHAINEFMRADFRLSVVRDTLTNQEKLDHQLVDELSQQVKKRVSVPGFRNSDKAPALVKVLPTAKAFEKYPELVAALIACWAEIHQALREQIYTLLKTRQWPMLSKDETVDISSLSVDLIKRWPVFPIDFNRTRLPGFYTHWPKGEDFEALYKNFTTLNPDSPASIDKLGLMTVWLTMRLPYHVDVDLQSNEVAESNDRSSEEITS